MSSRASGDSWRAASSSWRRELFLEGAVVAEPGQAVEQRVLAGPAVEVEQPGAVVLEALDVVEDRLGSGGPSATGTPIADSGEEGERHPGRLTPPGQKPSTAATPMSTANIAARTRSNRRRIRTGGPS